MVAFQVLVLLFCLKLGLAEPPKIVPMVALNQVQEGGSIGFFCNVERGSRPFAFRWLKDSVTLERSLDVEIEKAESDSTLRIRSVKPHHSGNYSCVVENAYGKDVQTPGLIVKVPLRWTREPQDVKTKTGETVTLHCEAVGYPVPTMSWKRKGKYVLQKGGLLTITNVKPQDAGEYECIVENSNDGNMRKLVKVTIKGNTKKDDYIVSGKPKNYALVSKVLAFGSQNAALLKSVFY